MLNRVFAAFRMCLNTYTCMPLPVGEADEDLRRVSDAFLPAAGLIVGLVWWILAVVCRRMLPEYLGAVLVALYPFIAAGFVHVQGFADVTGKLLSRRNCAAVAVSMLPAMLVLLQFACCMSIDRIFPLAMIPVLSRVCMALRIFAPKKQDAEGEEEIPASLIRIEKYIAVFALILLLLFSEWQGLLAGAAVLCGWTLCVKLLKGEECDVCGFALTVSELCALIVLAIV